jgi:hypothetical protein
MKKIAINIVIIGGCSSDYSLRATRKPFIHSLIPSLQSLTAQPYSLTDSDLVPPPSISSIFSYPSGHTVAA